MIIRKNICLFAVFLFVVSCATQTNVSELEQASHVELPRGPLRIMTYNVKMKPAGFSGSSHEFKDANGNVLSNDDRARTIAQKILAIGDIDVFSLQEVFEESSQKAFVEELHSVYPYYVQFLDEGDADQDSGLMLFSKHPFVSLEEEEYKADDVLANNGFGIDSDSKPNVRWEHVAFVPYGDVCWGASLTSKNDCWGNKGAGLVQIEHLTTGERFAVVFTHTQASYHFDEPEENERNFQETADVRYQQFELIEEMIRGTLSAEHLFSKRVFLLGDLNVNGNLHAINTDEYNSLFGGGYNFYSCFASECPHPNNEMELFKDSWAQETIATDLGRTSGADLLFNHDPAIQLTFGSRLDYILHSLPQGTDTSENFCAQHLMIPWQVAGESGEHSDHLPILGDYNLEAPLCSPKIAQTVSASTIFNSSTQTLITHPGSMQWYKIVNEGAYSFLLNGHNSLRFEVYEETDLSRPLKPYTATETDFGIKYDLPDPPYYVRVSSIDSSFTGNYTFSIHKHGCTSSDDACPLRPVISKTKTWPSQPINQDDQMYFEFFTDVSENGIAPSIMFDIMYQSNNSYEVTLHEGTSPYNSLTTLPSEVWINFDQTGNTIKARPIPLEGLPNDGGPKRYLLLVKRVNGMSNDPMDLVFKTSLTYFQAKKMRCVDQNDNLAGADDEIYFFFDIDDAIGVATILPEDPPFNPYAFLGDFNSGTSIGQAVKDKIGIHRYVNHIVPNLSEEDGGANGNNDYLEIRPVQTLIQSVTLSPTEFDYRLGPLDFDIRILENVMFTWEPEGSWNGPNDIDSDPSYRYEMRYTVSHEPCLKKGCD